MSDGDPKKGPKGSKERTEGGKSILPEGLRKAIQSGANVLFASDEGGKKSLGELRLPKDAMQFLMLQAERSRKDLFKSARHEMRRVLESVDLRREVRRALVGLKVQVKAEITFTEDDTQVRLEPQTLVKSTKSGAPRVSEAPPGDKERVKDAKTSRRPKDTP